MIWFKRLGWFYLPIHFAGIMVTLLAIAFLIPVGSAVIRNCHSVSDALYNMFVYTTCTVFWWKWVAEKTSADKEP
jgi:hypothetical protein